jgi:ATP-dependent protease ClpP protease subunit
MNRRRNIFQCSELIYNIHNFGLNADTREVFLHPDYSADSDDAEVDYRMASTLIKNLCFLNTQGDGPITIHMCSCGGSWEYGMAIYDAIKSSKSIVYIIAYAHARSMSSIILQAGDYRFLTPNAYVMIHDGSDGWDGTSRGLITHAEQAKIATNTMLDIYVNACKIGSYFKNKTDLQIRNHIKRQLAQKQEWYLSAQDAIKYGFADYVVGDDPSITIDTLLKKT